MRSGFFEDAAGDRSSTRLYSGVILIYAMLMGFLALYLGYKAGESVMGLAPIAGSLFMLIAGPVMVFLYQQKKIEVPKNNTLKQ